MSVYVCKYECIFLNIYTERERERAREREIHFKELAHTTEGLASPKSARQASRLETQGRGDAVFSSPKTVGMQNYFVFRRLQSFKSYH